MSNVEPSKPLISVIICTYNRCESLSKALQSLEKMPVPVDLAWELLVIDNNSSDKTPELVKSVIHAGTALPLKYVFESIPGLSCARNRGIRESRGEIIAFLDDDVVVSPQWLIEVRRAFQLYDAICAGGRVLLHDNNLRPSWWDKRYNVAVGEFDHGIEAIIDEREETLIGIGANIIFRRSAFDLCGGFRTDMGRNAGQLTTGEETDMVQRLRRQKQRVMYYPDALVYHCVPAERFSKRYLRRHFYNSGRWYFLKELDAPDMGARVLGVPRWRYRAALSRGGKLLSSFWQGRRAEAFSEQLQIAFFLGYFSGAQQSRRKPHDKSTHSTLTPGPSADAAEETGELVTRQNDDGR
jgi:glucosyl-dolichyl phosphate glucuronosyltransferase